MDEETTAEGLSHSEAFSLLGNETRVAILRELWAAIRDGPVPFSELRERVGMRDSGQFNYHLNKLTDHFIRKTEEGYMLRFAGAAVVGAILGGMYDRAGFDEPVPVGDECLECGGGLQLTYTDERATLACSECETPLASAAVPSGVFADREDDLAPVLFDRWLRANARTVAAGFCMVCNGPIETRVVIDEVDHPSYDDEQPLAVFECTRCGEQVLSTVTEAMSHHPAVVSFHYDHGIDVRTEPSWKLDWFYEPVEIVSEEPLRVSFTISLGDEALALTVDEELAVVESERVPTSQVSA
jgi:hypothetical protein